jgi:MFS transporter, YNFM family, putative membrane transport protein
LISRVSFGGRFGNRLIIFYTTVFAFAALYTPQPLLPVLKTEFSVSQSTASLLITVTLLPLGFAPIIFGLLLQSFSARKLMLIGVSAVMASELAIFFSNSFPFILFVRFLQGLCIPAIFTSLMTYLSATSEAGSVQRVLSLYIAATIFGGFFGRLLSGFVSTYFGWRYSFLTIFFALLVSLLLLLRLKADPKAAFYRIRLGTVTDVMRISGFLRVYLIIFCSFFVFASLLNFIPFRLTEIGRRLSEFRISTIYTGYLMGCVAAFLSIRIIGLLGGAVRAIRAGLSLYLLASLLFVTRSTTLVFFNMFVFCSGMFLVHSVCPGFINRHARDKKGVVNGLYISFYYAGGTLGSYLPGAIYKNFGWTVYVYFLAAILALALCISWGLSEDKFSMHRRAAGERTGQEKGAGKNPEH